jgi:HK97 family phage major capsid protein
LLSAVLIGGGHGHDIRAELGTTPDADGGFAVPTFLANEFIDKLRAAMVLSRAGARSIHMPGKTFQLAKIAADPAVAWHAENANITATQPTLDAVVLTAKTIVVTTKFSVELAQDSANISQILQRSLVQA